jgi:hypothetical protein
MPHGLQQLLSQDQAVLQKLPQCEIAVCAIAAGSAASLTVGQALVSISTHQTADSTSKNELSGFVACNVCS